MVKDRALTDEERRAWREEVGELPRTKPAGPAITKKQPAPPPPAAKKAKPSLVIQPQRQAARLLKPHARIEAKIDLHGMTQDEAHPALARFIAHAHAAGKRHVVVITGKGRGGEGVLKRAVPQWLEMPALRPLVSAISYAAPTEGGEGVLHVLLKKS